MNTYVLVKKNTVGQFEEMIGPCMESEVALLRNEDPDLEVIDELVFKVLYPTHHDSLCSECILDAAEVWISSIDEIERPMYKEAAMIFSHYWVIDLGHSEDITLFLYRNCCGIEAAKITNCLKEHFPVPLVIKELHNYQHLNTQPELN